MQLHVRGIVLPRWTTQLLLFMKLTTILVLAACLQVSARSMGQRVSLQVKAMPLPEVFAQIKQQTGYVFIYTDKDIAYATPASITVKEKPLAEVLQALLKNQPLAYEIQGNTVFISARPAEVVLNATGITADPVIVQGTVRTEKGEPLPGAYVRLKGTTIGTSTNEKGMFTLVNINLAEAVLEISYVGYQSQTIALKGRTEVSISMVVFVNTLDSTGIQVISTGYQVLPKERATGSFEKIDNALFNRSTGPDVLTRLEGVTSGLIFDKRQAGNGRLDNLHIRGISTLTDQMAAPLIILDNFPYPGDINSVNPNDVESITILKDAAAASIWGVRGGNGVIVITTKKGGYDKPMQVSFNSNITVSQRQNLFYQKTISSSDYIDVEQMLFQQGFYDGLLNDVFYKPVVSPVVALLAKARAGTITVADADQQINTFRRYDVRDDLLHYVYRKPVQQQYALSVSGGASQVSYLLSAGYDKSVNGTVNNRNDRVTLRSELAFRPVKRLEVQSSIFYTQRAGHSPTNYGALYYDNSLLPYQRLADEQGAPLTVPKTRSQAFIDTAQRLGFLDWRYRPLAELNTTSATNRTQDMLVNINASYRISGIFSADLKYQYNRSTGEDRALEGAGSYYTRNMVNEYTQFNGTDIVRPIPEGGILNTTNAHADGYVARGQLNANNTWNNSLQLAAIAGVEIREDHNRSASGTTYGYDDNLLSYQDVDFLTTYQTYFFNYTKIPSGVDFTDFRYRYTSLYSNASLTYLRRYVVSASVRKDASNLFGVKANQKGVPLWSAGISWNISDEPFYKSSFLPCLKLRATYGYQGNTDNNLSAYGVIAYTGFSDAFTGMPTATIRNLENANLRWEKVGLLNLGLDFGVKGGALTGSVEYYRRHTRDALSLKALDPSSGFSYARFNNASLQGTGIDVQLHSNNLRGAFGWKSDFLFSYFTNKVTAYEKLATLGGRTVITNGHTIMAIEGKPTNAIFAYQWAGLDPATGDPRGYVNGAASTDYAQLLSAEVADLDYHGSALPVYFGSLRNTFSLGNLSISANIIYKLGYYFRRNSISYSSLFNSNGNGPWGTGHADFAQRWQHPGDEAHTDVPSMRYPNDDLRDEFYTNSSALVSRADHIRLQDVIFQYQLAPRRSFFKNIRIYGNISNIGILWRANQQGIDPDYSGIPTPLSFAFGVNANF